MSGFDNEVVVSLGHRLEPSTSQAITLMQKTSSDVSNINHVGDPNGVVAANPASLCHDPSTGNLWKKQTGTGNTGWVLISTGSGALTITGNTGGAISPVSDNWNLRTSNSTLLFSGTAGSLALNFAATTNLGLGSSYPSLTTGSNNTSLGHSALESITSGGSNVCIGTGAGASLTTGVANVAVGYAALLSQTHESYSVAIGSSALGSYNSGSSGNCAVAIGYLALAASISGVQNTAVGRQCLRSVASGTSYNTAVGDLAGFSLSTGEQNTIMGASALKDGSSFSNCAAFGYQALNACDGDNNSAFGRASLVQLISGVDNCAIGANSMFDLLTGSFNTSLGSSSLQYVKDGSYNIGIGYQAGNSLGFSDSSNICLGSQGVTGDNNTIRIGEQGSGNNQQDKCFIAGINGVTVTGTSVICAADGQLGTVVSSERYKENIEKMPEDISVMSLTPVKFNYLNCKEKSYGLIAEEVAEKFPYLCFYKDEKPESVKYHELCVFLLAEIQRLDARVKTLENK